MIIPVILESNFEEIKRKLSVVDGGAELIQIDVCDGIFAKEKTYLDVFEISKIHTKSDLEIHLMVENPLDFVKVKIGNVVSMCSQIESPGNFDLFIQNARKLNYRVGVSLNPETEIGSVEKYINKVDYLQFLAVDPGTKGGKMIEGVIEKIKEFRKKYPNIIIQIDGGVKESNLLSLLQIGVNNAVIGSEIFNSKNPKVKLKELKAMLPAKKEKTDQVSSLSDVKKIQKIAVLGGAAWKETDQTYKDAFEVSKLLAENGYELINGGGPGVMKAATEGSHAGGQHSLVVTYHPNKPKRHYEGVSPENKFDEEIITLDYFDRTKVMLQNTDVHIIFKGSIGTLSEFGMTWVSSWIHEPNSKPIILYGAFWNELLDVIEKCLVIKMGEREILKICSTPKEVLEYIKSLEKN